MVYVQFRIHPSVGIARVGNSPSAYHLTREFPSFLQEKFDKLRPAPRPRTHPWNFAGAGSAKTVTAAAFSILNSSTAVAGKYKDNAGKVMPQAARFRIFAYVYSDKSSLHPRRVVEVTNDTATIEWKVQLGNVKSIKSAGGRKNDFNVSPTPVAIVADGTAKPSVMIKPTSHPTLGFMFLEQVEADKTKTTGRLHLIGNSGDTEGATHPKNGLWFDDWYDSAADGPVQATITPDLNKLKTLAGIRAGESVSYFAHGTKDPQNAAASGQAVAATPAWAVVGLPDYSPDMGHFVTLHDIALTSALGNINGVVPGAKATVLDGHHRSVAQTSSSCCGVAIDTYQKWDYDIHIFPQLCLFGDVNSVSGLSDATPGHNKPPASKQMKIEPRGADDADLRAAGALAEPFKPTDPRPGLKKGIVSRLRKPGTLYRIERNFVVGTDYDEDDDEFDTHDTIDYDAGNRRFPRRLGRRTDFGGGNRYPVDNDSNIGLNLGFPHEVNAGPNLKQFRELPRKIKREKLLCGSEKSFKYLDATSDLIEADTKMLLIDDEYWPATPADMPFLRELAYTHIQYAYFDDWSQKEPANQVTIYPTIATAGLTSFFAADHGEDEYFDELMAQAEPYAPALLDLAHLGSMLGGSFLPGIEVGREGGVPGNWMMNHGGTPHFADLRFHPCDRSDPHKPGMLTKDLAIPWQRDFSACQETYWPTSRPGKIKYKSGASPVRIGNWMMDETDYHGLPSSHTFTDAEMIEYYRNYWHKLGFVRRQSDGSFLEQERPR